MELVFVAFAVGIIGGLLLPPRIRGFVFRKTPSKPPQVSHLLATHFAPITLEQVAISERKFPYRVRADLQRAIDRVFADDANILHFCGVQREFSHEGANLADCMIESPHNPTRSSPPIYEEVHVGDAEPVRCLRNGLWLLERQGQRYVVLLASLERFGQTDGIGFQIGTANTAEGTAIRERFFRNLETAVSNAECYRGKILSLEQAEHSYSGKSSGITVHKLRSVEREQVILPAATLELLDRNVIQFVEQRSRLAELRQATRKGILFYGPPGTGKTHTIHYLAKALTGHTTLLITAEQVGMLAEYMTLARLLQPSIVVIEDVDLIARERSQMAGPCEEVLLNKLLNEMDGLKEEADILFLLTTNRPEMLEQALASRPGRIDQAIEFPLPDDAGREKLVRLYSQKMTVPEAVVAEIVRRTDQVSGAFIKELMRRAAQFVLERNGGETVEHADVDAALQEMLFSGGSLNLKLLGGAYHLSSAARVGF